MHSGSVRLRVSHAVQKDEIRIFKALRSRFGKDAVMSAGALARRNKDTEPKR